LVKPFAAQPVPVSPFSWTALWLAISYWWQGAFAVRQSVASQSSTPPALLRYSHRCKPPAELIQFDPVAV
jgi:hypothetical protein